MEAHNPSREIGSAPTIVMEQSHRQQGPPLAEQLIATNKGKWQNNLTTGTSNSAYHNSMHKVPDDILETEIFAHIHAIIFAAQNRSRAATEWMVLLRVCSRWRRILHTAARFWHIIPAGASPERLSYFLARSASQPVDVIFRDARFPSSEIVPLLQPVLSRIRLFSVDVHAARNYTDWFTPLTSLFAHTMPMLEDLHVRLNRTHLQRRGDVVLALGQFPRLQHLSLELTRAPTGAFPTNLRTLNLQQVLLLTTLEQFLDVLEACPDLEFLDLFRCSLLARGAVLPALPCRPPIRLRRLRELHIFGEEPSTNAAILAHIDAPAVERVGITSELERVQGGDDFRLRDLFVAHAHVRQALPDLSGLQGTIRVYCAPCRMVYTSFDSTRQVALSMCEKMAAGWYTRLASLLADLVYVFGDAHLGPTQLEIACCGFAAPVAVWEEVFAALPELTYLDVTGRGSAAKMWTGLQCATDRSPAGQVCCRNLKTVRIQRVESMPGLSVIVDSAERLKVLRARARRGAVLEELNVVTVRKKDMFWEAHSEYEGSEYDDSDEDCDEGDSDGGDLDDEYYV
ncbi:hypothetical protein BD413DRAFT_539268 [Trametes elegans]|nr:hypothetical protein BD413DRAFT_539268 [Trametes elegans]